MVDEVVWQGRELGRFVNEFTWFLRNILVVKLSSAEGDRLDMTKENLERVREISGHMEESTIRKIYKRVLGYSRQHQVFLTEEDSA